MKVLVADDDGVTRMTLRITLAAEGYVVLEAANGVEALCALRADPFDVLISDILMPEMDGYRLCREIRRDDALKALPVIIYSSTDTSIAEEDVARSMGANLFLRKPAATATILSAVEQTARSPVAAPDPCIGEEGMDVLTRYSERLVRQLKLRNLQLVAAKEDLARSNAELQRSAAQVRLLLDSTTEGIYGLDLDGRITFANFACVSILGYKSPEDLLGKSAHDLIHHTLPGGAACARGTCVIDRAREGVEVRAQTEVLWRADGTSLSATHWTHPMRREDQLVGSVVTFIDVTERELAQRQLRKSDKRFKRLFDSNTIGIVVANLSGAMLEANDAHLQMIGYTRKEFDEGRIRWNDLTPPEFHDTDQRALEELRRTGVCAPWEKELLRKDGTRVPILIGIAMLEPSEESCIAYIVDLSKARKLEDQLRHAQKLEAVGLLAGGVAHDFNNLLTVILGHGDILLRRLKPSDPLRDGLSEIMHAGERASDLTRQLLAFSRRQILLPVVLNLNDVVSDLEKMLRRLIREDIEVGLFLDRRVGRVKADPGQIEQVIMNLVVNARDAMPDGGKLTIETQNVELDAAYAVRHSYVVPGPYVLLAISDTGIGMDAATRARAFEPFFTTKAPGKGTGLGLSTVYGIVKQSGGSIEFYSEHKRGTSFKVYLPRVDDEASVPARRSEDMTVVGGSETILLVEDDEAVRSLGRGVLVDYGYAVLEAASGEAALAVSAQHMGTIDLIVTDMVMPGRSGSEIVRLLAVDRPAMRALYVSGYTTEAVFRHGLLEGATAFLPKPFTPQALARKVREVLGKSNE